MENDLTNENPITLVEGDTLLMIDTPEGVILGSYSSENTAAICEKYATNAPKSTTILLY